MFLVLDRETVPSYNYATNKKEAKSSEKKIPQQKYFLYFIFSAAEPESNVLLSAAYLSHIFYIRLKRYNRRRII